MEEELLTLTAKIVSAIAGANDIEADHLPTLITNVYQTLAIVGQTAVGMLMRPRPAVPTERSLRPDRIVCLECGRKLQLLRRHIIAAHGMTPEQYRAKWELPHDYPMVSDEYAARQSVFARMSRAGMEV